MRDDSGLLRIPAPLVSHPEPAVEQAICRVLVVDDANAIHDDVRKALASRISATSPQLDAFEAELFGPGPGKRPEPPHRFVLESAFQGEEAIEAARRAKARGEPFAIAVVDVLMPPGLDGLETIDRLWADDPSLRIMVCTAYSHRRVDDFCHARAGGKRLTWLEKPFELDDMRRGIAALFTSWRADRR